MKGQEILVKYCQFLKDMGDIDSTTPGIVDSYKEWKKSHRK